MNQRWTLHIRNFGPIQSADIELHPFMMFVGPNNSGKSYLNTLIWGLLTQGKTLFDGFTAEGPAYKACCDWLIQEENHAREYSLNRNSKNSENYISTIGNDEIQLFVDWFNELLHARKKEFLRALFNSDVIDAERLSVSNCSSVNPVSIKWNSSSHAMSGKFVSMNYDGFSLCFSQEPTEKLKPELYLKIMLIRLMVARHVNEIDSVACDDIWDFKIFKSSSLYLPADRTGFMLNFRSLAFSMFEQGFSLQDRPKGLHTMPAIRFLQGLLELPKEENGTYYKEIVDWLENKVINGSFLRQDDVLPNFRYTPKESNQELALYLCSSLVTELAPLVLFLKGSDQYGTLIIEEPEAHLHPEAQRKTAQALVRLVNKGLPVWITTHSDIMFQQFNNLIALSHLPNRAEVCQAMGYEESDILDPKDAVAYQFIVHENGTIVEPLNLIETGFEAPSFNQSLADLTAETITLHDLTDELESDQS